MRPSRSVPAAVLALAVASLGLTSAPTLAAAETVRYPSAVCPTNADHGLQDCVDQVDPGSTIVLVDEVIDETIGIRKSLTLRGARGVRPVLRGLGIDDGGPGSSLRIAISDLRVRYGIRGLTIEEGSGHRVTIQRVEVGRDSNGASGIEFGAFVPMSLTVEDSYIRSVQTGRAALQFYTVRDGGTARFRAAGNEVTQHGADRGRSGIEVTASKAGTTYADIMGNSVFDVAREDGGGSAGIVVRADDKARVDADVVGNTVAVSGNGGFAAYNALDSAGSLRLDLFDNTFSQAAYGIYVGQGDHRPTTLRAGYNNTYAVKVGDAFNGLPKGPGNLHKDPRFIDIEDGDLRLRSSSPLIDHGLVCTPGGQTPSDAAGHHRLAGRSVDIGAYERGAGSASGVVRLGTSGRDTLRGTTGRDILCSFGGNDTLCAKDGTRGDYLDGGSGRDRARTDSGDTRRSIESTARC